MIALRLKLLGSPALDVGSDPRTPLLGPGKPLALLAYLAVRGPLRREELIALLWGEMPEDKARNAFRQALHRLRNAMGGELAPTGRDVIGLPVTSSLTVDLRDFEAALDAGRTADAIQLFCGEFLQGLDLKDDDFGHWVTAERSRIGARFHSALTRAAQEALEAGDVRSALAHATRLSACQPFDADAAVVEATILIAAGRQPEALNALEGFKARMQAEFGTAPSPAVVALIGKLRKPLTSEARRTPGRTTLPFVGRDSDITVLMGEWRRAQGGEGGTILLDGVAGIGKTRLIDEFLSRVRDMGTALLLRGRERGGGAAVPHASIAEALRGALAAPGLAGASQHLLAEAARLLPELRDQFALPALSTVSDDAERVRFFEGVAAFLDAVAYEQPVCVVLEDLHNASTNTLDLAQYLSNRLRASGVLFVLSARNGTFADRFSESARVVLQPLEAEAARMLASAVLAEALAPPLEIDEIVGASEGVPLRVIETARRVAAGKSIGGVPAGIRDILSSRLQGASPVQQRLFVAVALFDRAVPLRLLAAAAHLPEIAALESAIALEQFGLVTQDAGGIRPAHDVASSLALEGTGSAGIALLAGWAAEALAAEPDATDAELGHLYAMAGRSALAFTHSIVAAYQAMTAAATVSALHFLSIADSCAHSQAERERVSSLRSALGAEPARLIDGSMRHADTPADPLPVNQRLEPLPAEEATTRAEPTGPAVESNQERGVDARSPTAARKTWRFSRLGALAGMIGIAVLLLLSIRARGAHEVSLRGRTLTDTLVLKERVTGRPPPLTLITGDLADLAHLARSSTTLDAASAWKASLKRPWVNPSVAPGGRFVSVERVTATGSDVYAIGANRRDTIAIAVGKGDNIASGWSPDGHWLLVIHGDVLADGTYDSDLYAYSMDSPGARIAMDTSRARAVSDAVWAPDGLHVAWAARTGARHQQDIFVSRPDGTGFRNLSNHPGEDYNPAWSADGTQVGFTSERSGTAQLYAADVLTGHLRRLTYDTSHNDRASFSPNGQFVAFESTRGGDAGVYVMASWGGTAHRVTPVDSRMSIMGWRGVPIPYPDQFHIRAPEWVAEGDSGAISVVGTDQLGARFDARQVRWMLLDSTPARFVRAAEEKQALPPSDTVGWLVGQRSGYSRLVASLGGWRTDTALIRVGAGPVALARDDFERGLSKDAWISLGQPAPRVEPRTGRLASAGLLPMADREWESGVLSRSVFRIRSGLSVEAWMRAPYGRTSVPLASAAIALVAEESPDALDFVAPQFLRLVSISWLGDAGRIGYAVDREIFTEPAAALGAGDAHVFRFTIESDGRVAFYADGTLRWRSTIRATHSEKNNSAQLWLGGRGTGADVTFDDVSVWLAGRGGPPAAVEHH